MFFVYYGFASSDHYDSSLEPTYRIKEFRTADQVIQFFEKFNTDYLNDDCVNVIFRVFEGTERLLEPKEVVTSYTLK